MLKARLLATMGLLLLNSCATTLHDGPTCNAYPVSPGQCRGDNGAACDNFLTANQQILTAKQYEAEQETWESQGCVVETTNSCLLASVKGELEKLCSTSKCTTQVAAQVHEIIANIDRLTAMAQSVKNHTPDRN